MESTLTIVLLCPNGDVPLLEEALLALDLTPSSYVNLETGHAQIFVIPPEAETSISVEENAAAWQKKIRLTLKEFWSDCFENGLPEVTLQEIKQEDWANNWKKNFHTFRASERLVVKPSWEDYEAKPGETILPIDPGMCFGTGYHGTTRACLQFLDQSEQELRAENPGRPLSFIDAGTGSGILSLGAKLLGYTDIHAFDMDPQCIEQAEENFRFAGVTGIPVACAPLGVYHAEEKADVVAANILAVVLLEQATSVLDLCKAGGRIILSGILTEQYPDILRTFTALGCRELVRTTIDEWTSGLYQLGE